MIAKSRWRTKPIFGRRRVAWSVKRYLPPIRFTGHWPLVKLPDSVASNSSMARDSTGIREVATGRLPKPGNVEKRHSRIASAPGSDNVSISSSVA